MARKKKNLNIKEILYPVFNTRTLDNRALDGREYKEGLNLKGPLIPQHRWDMDAEKNVHDPAWDIQPGARMVVQKQEQFFEWIFQYPEVFFGGARGGAKTAAELKSHMVKHLSWKVRGITGQTTAMFTETKEELLRRHIVELPKNIPTWMGKYDADAMIWNFHEKFGGGRIMFLYIGRKDVDIERLLSYQMPFITVDELTRNSERSYLFLSSCLRSTVVPADEWCVASASNPGSKGHKWVNKRFVKSKERKRAFLLHGERRAFIQSLPRDNPLLPAEYWEKQLNKLPPALAKAYRDGDWSVFEGQYFDMLDDEAHLVAPYKPPDSVVKRCSSDIGSNHPTGCVWWMHYPPSDGYPAGRIVVYRYYEERDKSMSRHKRNIWNLMKHDKNMLYPMVLSHDAWSNNGSENTWASMFQSENEFGPAIECESSGRDRKGRWILLLDLLAFEDHVDTDENGISHRIFDRFPVLQFMDRSDVRVLYDELAGLVHKESDPEDVESPSKSEYEAGEGDEGPDCLGAGLFVTGEGVFYSEKSPEPEKPKYDPLRDMPERFAQRGIDYATFVM